MRVLRKYIRMAITVRRSIRIYWRTGIVCRQKRSGRREPVGGGIGLRFPWGNLIHTNQAQYTYSSAYSYDLGPNNSPSGPSPVGSLDINGYGLYDMAGNMFVWCWDGYGTTYGQPSTINPTGIDGGGRMIRGGSWVNYADRARCAYREVVAGYLYGQGVGLRCVRGL